MDLKSHVILNVDANTYYKKRFPRWDSRARPNVSCVWHEDKKPSLSLALINGGAKCHTPGCSANSGIGNIVHFESKRLGIDEVAAARLLYSEFVRQIVPHDEIATLQKAFTSNRQVANLLLTDTGITAKTAGVFGIGYQERTKRYSIPVLDRWGNTVNFRLYKLPRHRSATEEGLKVINYLTNKGTDKEIRYGAKDLFPWPQFLEYTLDKPVFICASEKEALLAFQDGFQTVCSTAGEGSWDEEWTQLFVGYDICILGQNDVEGRKAAEKRFATLQTVANSCAIVYPPTLKDYADWRLKADGQPLVILGLFKAAVKGALPQTNGSTPPSKKTQSKSPSLSAPALPDYYSTELIELAAVGNDPATLNKIVCTQGVIAAKATVTYTLPWRFKVRVKNAPQKVFSVAMGRDLLRFVRASDAQIKASVLELLDVESAQIEVDAHITATEIEVIPIATIDKDVPYVTQRCVYVGGRIESNIPYELEIIPTNEVRTQETVGLVVKALPIARAIESATFSEEDIATLQKHFRPKEGDTVWSMMEGIAEEVCEYQSKIFNRPDWHMVALLTWLSPIGWKFPYEKETQRGWLNSLALGDTETGKSKVTKTLQRIFGCGAFVNAENCTYVGLVGGAVKMGSGQFMLRWGRIPLSDKQLVVIEELSGLSVDEISNLSEVRSSGVARLDKGGLSAETNARTRLLALSNVRPVNRTLAQYLSGVKAVQELIGHGEDIARFDLIVTLTDREVSNEIINRPIKYSSNKLAIPDTAWQKLCQFAWSLKPEQVKITTEAYHACLELTKELAEIYHAGIPLFKGGSGRYKIARIAAAIATLQFSWDGKAIKVYEEHVDAAAKLMRLLYDKPSLGYLEWSQQMRDRDGVKDIKVLDAAAKLAVPNDKKRSKVMETLVYSAKFTRDELCAVGGLTFTNADIFIGVMVRERVLRKGEANTWEITPAGKVWMQEFILTEEQE